ncbi:DUF3631 domain-containing protein [Mesorhizobium sp. LHD-90]|uniref:bifunctional DNA primase/polymerase n=1 Tax=Mesorhizobium sp. LHD-90 TaxID=3071414 RepID=UPI0027E0E9D3|nr:DUF3631 domain-containing protein [Mesorhizobium sp. LHD-90]MDQ6437179.1 DUF3631 domain-containing protein [Mesorhizobium sp. LHD-90]
MTSEVLDAALDLAASGFPLIPVRRKMRSGKWRKVPVFGAWQDAASIDPETITRWFNLNYPQPDVGVAVLTGSRSGLLLLDVDSPAGHPGVDGFKSLKLLKAKTGLTLERVPGWLTQSNGNGFIFRLKPGQKITSSAGVLGSGLDVKGEGSFAVLPPSRLDMTRPPYQWLNGLRLADAPPLPEELADLLTRRRSKASRTLDDLAEKIRTAATGTAHDAIVSATWEAAGLIRDGKLSLGDVLTVLSPAAIERGHDKLEVEEALDGATAKRGRGKGGETRRAAAAAAAAAIADTEPWPEAVDGGAALDEAIAVLARHVVMTEEQRAVTVLWVLHTHLAGAFFHSPRLNVFSPTKRCGKSTLRRIVAGMVAKPMLGENVSAAVIYHLAELSRPSFLFDEVQSLLDRRNSDRPALLSLMCSGYERTGATWRMTGEGSAMVPRQFRTYAPMLLAGIGRIGGSLGDRCIPIQLRRKTKADAVETFDFDSSQAGLVDIGRKLARWAQDNSDAVQAARLDSTVFPSAFDDRQCDCARPLFKIAAVLGGAWPDGIRAALAAVWRDAVPAGAEEDDNLSIALLTDIREVFDGLYLEHQREAALAPKSDATITSSRLVDLLISAAEKPWAAFGRAQRPLTQYKLANMLRSFGVRPQLVGRERAGGYRWRQFAEVWERYS